MKAAGPIRLSLLTLLSLGTVALALSGQALGAPRPSQETLDSTEKADFAEIDKWHDAVVKEFKTPQTYDAYLSAMQSSASTLGSKLVNTPCRDGDYAKKIENHIHIKFHTFYGTIVKDVAHAVDLNCREYKLTVNFRITGFTPTAAMAATFANATKTNAAKAIVDAGVHSANATAAGWESGIAPFLQQLHKDPLCGKTCKDTIVDLTRIAARHIFEIPCDPDDKSRTLPEYVERLFQGKADKLNAANGNTLPIHPQANCHVSKRVEVLMTPRY